MLNLRNLSHDEMKNLTTHLMIVPFMADEPLQASPLIQGALLDQLQRTILKANLALKPKARLLYLDKEGGQIERVLLLPIAKKTVGFLDCFQGYGLIPILDLSSEAIASICCELHQLPESRQAQAATRLLEAIACAQDESDCFKSKRGSVPFQGLLKEVVFASTQPLSQSMFQKATALQKGLRLYKTIANMPGNLCPPQRLVDAAERLAASYPSLSVKIHRESELEKLGLRGLLAVGAGSAQASALIEIHYAPKNSLNSAPAAPIVLVGKAVTFDSGGISIKPSNQMDHMKFDLCGGAALLGVMESVATLELPHPISVCIAACENMPDGQSYRPGDILKMHSGLTVEVLNTDAEGRLALADALSYAEQNLRPRVIIDLATLTGACGVALGKVRCGLFTSDAALQKQIEQASETSGDWAWAMPMDEAYEAGIQTPHADLANTGEGGAGSITAAKFLQRFVEKTPWAHLDIATTAYTSGRSPRATGRPLPLILDYLIQQTS